MHFKETGQYPQRSSVNDGCDLFGRKIEVGDLLAKSNQYGKGHSLSTHRVTRIGFGKEQNSVAIHTWGDHDEAVRYSGRTIIIERANGLAPLLSDDQ